MPDDFDPYRDWLGITTPQRPPSHYALLGLAELERDAAKIAAAADARMREVRNHQVGPRGKFTQKLLNELAAAKLCLLDARAKAAYDAGLMPQPAAPPMFAAPHVPSPPSSPPPPVAAPPVGGRLEAPPKPRRSVADEIEEARSRSTVWLPLGLLFLCVIVAASGGMALYWQRPQTKLPDPEQTTLIEPEPVPEPELVIEQEGSGDLNLPLSVGKLSGGVTARESGGQTHLEHWNSDEAAARWKFKLVRPAVFQVRLEYAASNAGQSQF
jgi:hypothetical protein